MTTQITNLTEVTSTEDGDLLLIRDATDGVDKKMQAQNLRAKATTKDDVGLGSVPNLDTTDAVSKAHDQNTDTALNQGGANEVTAADARAHIDSTANPHNVTKTQVGLGDVDNVSAANLRDRSTHTGTQDATTVDYNNASSGLSATDVQDAIDEVASSAGGASSADNVTYDNASSGLSATDVQNAIDEVAAGGGSGTGTMSTQNADNVNITGGSITGITDLAVADGGTGASDAPTARTNLGIGNVDNVSAANLRDRSTHTGTQPLSTISDAGTIASQDANSVAITGGTIDATLAYDNTTSGLLATDVQAAIDEVAASGGGASSADSVTYDNTASGLSATDVQAAIDEVNTVVTSTSGAAKVDNAAGDYGTVKVDDDRGVSFAGYAIRDDWVFMSDGSSNAGIYNDTDNEWSIRFNQNSTTDLMHNGSEKLRTESYGVLVSGEVRATDNVTAYFSDERLKDFDGIIPNALGKVTQINGYYFHENAKAKELGYNNSGRQVGVSAQQVQQVLPEVVDLAAVTYHENSQDQYLAVHYDKLVPVLIEAIKEQQQQIDKLREAVNGAS